MGGMRKSERRTLKKDITPIDWARLAAYIDGEGCMCITPHYPNRAGKAVTHAVRLNIVNTDARLIQWISNTLGVGIVSIRNNNHPSLRDKTWTPQYVWTCDVGTTVDVLKGCLPYFIIKGEQAEIMIEFQATKGVHPSRGGGVPNNVIAFREKLRVKLNSLHTQSNGKRGNFKQKEAVSA
jgi:hypothetical protein